MYDDNNLNENGENKNEETSGTYSMTRDELQDQKLYTGSRSNAESTYEGSFSEKAADQTEASDTVRTEPSKKAKKRRKGSFAGKVLKTACLAAVFGLVAGGVMVGVNTAGTKLLGTNQQTVNVVKTSSEYVSTSESMDVTDIVSSVMPSIVAVNTTIQQTTTNWFGQTTTQEGTGAGSGIILSQSDGTLYIMTNNHVIEDSTTVSVQFADGTSASAEIKGYDEDGDIAVLTVNMSDLSDDTLNAISIATFGDSDTLQAGESAIAIGNALGYGQSVTTGVISAASREVSLTDKTMTLVQTSAAINPGNSGGALLNGKGEVIGVNTVKYSDTDVEGMGFAIPINTALEIADGIIDGTITNDTASGEAYLGIRGGTLSEEYASMYNAPAGVYIASVADDSAASRAGLSAGCIITEFNGETVSTMEDLQSMIAECEPGDSVTMTAYFPDSQGNYTEQELTTIMGSKSDATESSSSSSSQNDQSSQYGYGQNGQSSQYGYGQQGSGQSYEQFE